MLSAYEITGKKWIGTRTDFYFDFTGNSPGGLSWNAAFSDALNEWNTKTPFKFYLHSSYICLLYTSDAADDTPCVDLGGRRIIK